MDKCPRQDPNNLKTGDIFEINCPICGEIVVNTMSNSDDGQ